MDDLIGQTINERYFIKSMAGRGNMASVYQVWDQHRATHMAMKVLREDLAEDKIFLRRFQREAQTLSRLQHPNIVRCYGLEREGAIAFLLLDFVDGVALRRVIFDTDEPSSPEAVLEIIRPVCAALHYAHLEGYVHCDLKPGNVMIDNSGRIFITDFGISRMTESATATMVGYGTPAYMAPEQIRGQDPTPQTDIYALGIILYELFSGGERPFTGVQATITGSTGDKVRWEHLNVAPIPLRSHHPDIAPELEATVMRCLEKKPEDRFSDALEVIEELERTVFALFPGAQNQPPVPMIVPTLSQNSSRNSSLTPPPGDQNLGEEPSETPVTVPVSRRFWLTFGLMGVLVIFVILFSQGNFLGMVQPTWTATKETTPESFAFLLVSNTPTLQNSKSIATSSSATGSLLSSRETYSPTPTKSKTPSEDGDDSGSITVTPGTKKILPSITDCLPLAELEKNANCRDGPDVIYDIVTTFTQGEILDVIGKNQLENWWLVSLPNSNGECWISKNIIKLTCCDDVAIVGAPPTPTGIVTVIQATSTKTSKPQATQPPPTQPPPTQPPPTQPPPTQPPPTQPPPTQPPPTSYPGPPPTQDPYP